MCGRYTLYTDPQVIEAHFNATLPADFKPRYNIAPNQIAPVIREGASGRQFAMMQWGLVPHWSKTHNIKYSTINARAETLADKPVYRTPFRRSRCLVPSTGFYEWKDEGRGHKQPYLIQQDHNLIMAFAGLWDHWTDGEEKVDSFTIIVTGANDKIKSIHERMPVIMRSEDYDLWLDPDTEVDHLKSLLVSTESPDMTIIPVSRYVNNPNNDGPRCIEPIGTAKEKDQ
jgi:putative SOS response-associated peptidase YedK